MDVEITEVEARPTGVVRAETSWPELSATIREHLDTVWAVMGTEPLRALLSHDPFGENVIVYLDATPTIEIGVLVTGPFDPVGGVQPSQLPGGRVARAVHRGTYDTLGATHDQVQAWCEAQGHVRSGISWEHYGHWHDDPAELETAVCYLLKG